MIDFIVFNPQLGSKLELPQGSGNFLICMRQGSLFPKTSLEPTFCIYKELRVLYTGMSSNIRKRNYDQHFNGDAGKSSLRKSIGSLIGYKQIIRDKNKPNNGKTKFNEQDELELSQWMKTNLLLFYIENDEYKEEKQNYIDTYDPPLNLIKNEKSDNLEFRKSLSLKIKEYHNI